MSLENTVRTNVLTGNLATLYYPLGSCQQSPIHKAIYIKLCTEDDSLNETHGWLVAY